ncbi:hypothetical protein DFH09DRAFT_1067801 [Mycena vulgaris]|nr:hypothetical protein DFH09DRAFT_1067801 [Mycena vulgaris]
MTQLRQVAQKPHVAFGGATSVRAAFWSLAQVFWDVLISHSDNVGEEYRVSPQAALYMGDRLQPRTPKKYTTAGRNDTPSDNGKGKELNSATSATDQGSEIKQEDMAVGGHRTPSHLGQSSKSKPTRRERPSPVHEGAKQHGSRLTSELARTRDPGAGSSVGRSGGKSTTAERRKIKAAVHTSSTWRVAGERSKQPPRKGAAASLDLEDVVSATGVWRRIVCALETVDSQQRKSSAEVHTYLARLVVSSGPKIDDASSGIWWAIMSCNSVATMRMRHGSRGAGVAFV